MPTVTCARILRFLITLTFTLASVSGRAQEASPKQSVKPIPIAVPKRDKPVSFFEEVLPILEEKCLGCHSLTLAEGKLNLEEVSTMLKGGKRGPAIIPGKGAESLLIKVASRQAEPFMPPPERKDYAPLTPEELGLIQLWIDQGAKDDSEEEEDSGPELAPLPPHLNAILAAEFSPDGRYIAVGRGNRVQVYDAVSGAEVTTLTGHLDYVQSLAWSPDGSLLASGSYRLVKVWRAPADIQLVHFVDPEATRGILAHAGSVTALAIQDDEAATFVTAGLDGLIKWWQVNQPTPLRHMASPAASPVEIVSLDKDQLLLGTSNDVVLISSDGKLKRRPSKVAVRAVAAAVEAGLAAVGYQNGEVHVLALPSLELVQKISAHKGAVTDVAFARDGKELVSSGADGRVIAWEPRSAKQLRVLRHGQGEVRALAISPLGNLIITAGSDKVARVWRYDDFQPFPAGGNQQRVLAGFTGALRSAAFSGDGIRVALGSDNGEIRTWEVTTGRVLHRFEGHVGSVNKLAYLKGTTWLVSVGADRSVRLWDCSVAWEPHLELTSGFAHRILALDFSPDGRLLATGGGEPSRFGEIKLFDARTGELVRDLGEPHSDTVFGLDFRPDGTMLASCGADKIARVFDLASGQQLRKFEGHTHHVLDVVWRWDGQRLVTCGADNVLKVWDFQTGEQVRTIGGHSKQVTALSVVPRTNQVVSCGADAQVRRYNTDNGGTVRTYGGARDFLYAVSVDAQARWVAAGGQASILWIWDLNNGRLLHQIGPPSAPSPAR